MSYSQSWASDADLVYLRAIPEVEHLDFFECGAVTTKGLQCLKIIKNLKTLRLSETSVNDLSPLSCHVHLEELEANDLPNLKESSIKVITKMPNLRLIYLTSWDTKLSDRIIPWIEGLKKMESLIIDYDGFSEEGKKRLEALKLKSV